MSLMNDALRKKNRENLADAPSIAPPAAPSPPRKRKKSFIYLGMVVMIGGSIVGGLVWFNVQNNASLMIRQPLAKQAGIPVTATTGQARINVAPGPAAPSSTAISGNASLHPSETRLDGVEKAQSEPAPTPAASDTSPPGPAADPALPLTAESMPRQMDKALAEKRRSIPLEGSQPSPSENQQNHVNSFEPGPTRAARPQQSGAVTEKRSKRADILEAKPQSISPPSFDSAEKTIARNPADSDLFYQKALACHRSGRLDEAARFYQSVLKTDPNHREAMLNLAAIYIEEDRFSQAAPLLKRLEKTPPYPEGLWLNLAITALGKDEPASALDYLARAEKAADATDWQIRFHRAVALTHLDRLSDAVSLYKQVEAERPDDLRIKFNLAITYDRLKDYQQAIDYYETVLKANGHRHRKDRQSILDRVGLLRRYLNTTPSMVKRQ